MPGALRRRFQYCKCKKNTVALNLIRAGFFPGSLVSPPVAFHFNVLIFYNSLNTATSTPVEPFQDALFQCLKEQGYTWPANVGTKNSYFYQLLKVCLQEPHVHSFSKALIWFKALRDLAQVQTERELLAPRKGVTIDEPVMTPKEMSMRLVESDPSPGAANDGDPSVALTPPGGDVRYDNLDMEIDQGHAGSASHPDRTTLLRRAAEKRASPYLRSRCPQCFGGSEWGGDVQS